MGGLLVDKIGNRKSLFLFVVLVNIGQGIFMLGGYQSNFNLMVFGRFVFALGNESMYVCQSAFVSEWFINFELPLAISLITSIPLLGSFLNGALLPAIYKET